MRQSQVLDSELYERQIKAENVMDEIELRSELSLDIQLLRRNAKYYLDATKFVNDPGIKPQDRPYHEQEVRRAAENVRSVLRVLGAKGVSVGDMDYLPQLCILLVGND